MVTEKHYSYDVAISYAGEDRNYAHALAEALKAQGISVFYDRYEKATLWGKNLYNYLSDLYQNQARYCIMLLSAQYAQKVWTTHEREAAQNRAVQEYKDYILPIRLDTTDLPGHLKTLAYLDWHEETPETITQAVLEKLGKATPQVTAPNSQNLSPPLQPNISTGTVLDTMEKAVLGRGVPNLQKLDLFAAAQRVSKLGMKVVPVGEDASYPNIESGLIVAQNPLPGTLMYVDPDYPEEGPLIEVILCKRKPLYGPERYEEALAAYEQAIRLDPNNAAAYSNEVNTLKDYYEAVRVGRVKDPKTIRDIAHHFAVLANDPNIDFDAERAANTLYERAKLYEEKARTSATSNIPAQPSPGK